MNDGYFVKRDAWHEMIESMGSPKPRPLPSNFMGQGKKEGFRYYRYHTGRHWYLYEVTNINTRIKQYEIIDRYVIGSNRKDMRELYPWEEPVYSNLLIFNNHFAAMDRLRELHKELNTY